MSGSRGMFQCGNGQCIPYNHVCDGENSCGDFSDERVSSCGKYRPLTKYIKNILYKYWMVRSPILIIQDNENQYWTR